MIQQERVLIVDDEQNLLDGLKRLMSRSFDMTFALGGPAGLEAIKNNAPFSVIVTDMRMPDMDGLAFIKEARKVSPNSVYMMLTGNSDQKTAVDAMNDGRVFRFLNKPCSRETLEVALQAAINQHRLQEAEKQLLERTLAGCVQALLQVLNLTHPKLFQRASRVSKIAFWLAGAVNDPHPWQVRIAAALAGIGCVALPDDLIDQVMRGDALSPEHAASFHRHAGIGAQLLAPIPRLERVSAIVRHQHALTASVAGNTWPAEDSAVAVLSTADALDNSLREGKPWVVACREVCQKSFVSEMIANALSGKPPEWIAEEQAGTIKVIQVSEMRSGMILHEDVKTVRGELLIASGNEVTEMLAERLRNFAKTGRTTKPVAVFVPTVRAELAAAA